MTWSSKNVPKSAEHLKGHERAIFVAAANNALKEYSNDDVRAIRTGLAAVASYRKSKGKKESAADTSKASMMDGLLDAFKAMLEKAFSEKEETPTVEVTKSLDVEQRRAMFVALAPNEIDEHGDMNTEEAVEKACISFNTLCNKANLFHRIDTQHAVIEQSYITPVGFTTDSGIEIKKGSWVQWWHFPENNENSELLWKMVKDGDIQGISVGATAVYTEIENDAES